MKSNGKEYGISVIFADEAYTSSRCPFHGNKCGKRITRGLFKCTATNKVFNADIVGAYNILVKGITITPSPREGIGVMGRRPDLRLNPKGDLAPNLPALAIPRTIAL
ncbi:MAG: transposase [Caldisphaeraceae archaeon]|nr:transposase [Caldisphaeraceae archaeon]